MQIYSPAVSHEVYILILRIHENTQILYTLLPVSVQISALQLVATRFVGSQQVHHDLLHIKMRRRKLIIIFLVWPSSPLASGPPVAPVKITTHGSGSTALLLSSDADPDLYNKRLDL